MLLRLHQNSPYSILNKQQDQQLESMNIKGLIKKAKSYLSEDKLALIKQAYKLAIVAHQGQVEHLLQTALIVANLQLDANCIAAALLHDVVEDDGVSLAEVESQFGAEVSKLVDSMNRISKVVREPPEEKPKSKKSAGDSQSQAENLRKMLMAMAEDIRVVLLRLADRLQELRSLEALPAEHRRGIAQETMDIYAPLAHRLGIWQLKWELEDLSFRYLEPDKHQEITDLVAAGRRSREGYIAQVIKILRAELEKAGLKAETTGRPKHIYSIYQKLGKYAAQGKEFSEIYDLIGLRIFVDELQDCYSVLGVIHALWHPLPSQFDDYIANPKENMYQSLHTTVVGPGAKLLEIQIRTHEMHHIAEYGIAAHWRYKEGTTKDVKFEEKMAWLRQLIDWQQNLSGSEFLESVKIDVLQDQVFVYTPKGEIKNLPAGSTPLDFAYRIHTDLGHRCVGAKVNGKLNPLNYQLQNGDTVEILTTKADRGPSRDWLNPNLGYIKTSHAREKIRQWFRRQERAENIQWGRELLDKELRKLGISLSERDRIARLFKYETLDDFLAALGCSDVDAHQIAVKLATPEERPSDLPEIIPRKPKLASAIQVLGVGDLLTHIAPCCNPVPGDEIVGFVTRTRGVTVHRKGCSNIVHEDEKQRLVEVDWGRTNQSYPVTVRTEAWDRVGLLRDLSTIVSEEKVNIATVTSENHDDGSTSIFFILDIAGIEQLSRLLSKLEGVRGVISVTRGGELPK